MKKAFWIVAMLLIASIGANVWLMTRQPDIETKIEHDTIWRDTTRPVLMVSAGCGS